ncbi:MAG: 3-phosphoshikimate 1-carboxyvinyltransferase [Pseudomonadota bacterium]
MPMTSPLTAHPAAALKGRCVVPGDKSISHRALIFGALAEGETRIAGLLEADDVMRTAAAVRALGASVEKEGASWIVTGAPWRSPDHPLYCGNAGTGSRLLMGAIAGQGIEAVLDGDRSLRSRPMGRILEPLTAMGVQSRSDDGKLPVEMRPGEPQAIRFALPKPSAQIKSAVLLAALGAKGTTIVEEPVLCRDHTERMLPAFGVPVTLKNVGDGREIHLTGPATLKGTQLTVPADPSSAAFPVAAALLVEGSEVTVTGVLANTTRTGLYETLQEMGATLSLTNRREQGGEPVVDIVARFSNGLSGVTVPAARVPSMVDEYPILAVIAAKAKGTTRMEGLAELRVKESDRLSATAALLRTNGVACREGDDWLEVDGGDVPGGGKVETHDDHRIAMAALMLGLGASQPVSIDDAEMIGTSFTGFVELMETLGARIS